MWLYFDMQFRLRRLKKVKHWKFFCCSTAMSNLQCWDHISSWNVFELFVLSCQFCAMYACVVLVWWRTVCYRWCRTIYFIKLLVLLVIGEVFLFILLLPEIKYTLADVERPNLTRMAELSGQSKIWTMRAWVMPGSTHACCFRVRCTTYNKTMPSKQKFWRRWPSKETLVD